MIPTFAALRRPNTATLLLDYSGTCDATAIIHLHCTAAVPPRLGSDPPRAGARLEQTNPVSIMRAPCQAGTALPSSRGLGHGPLKAVTPVRIR
jgi:hypothetical protein